MTKDKGIRIMTIYTSYFAKSGSNPKAISISLFSPAFWKGKCLPELAPSIDLLERYKDGLVSDKLYEKEYLRMLRSRGLTPKSVAEIVGDEAVLLCYEKSDKFCHRHVLAAWLRKAGFDAKEL